MHNLFLGLIKTGQMSSALQNRCLVWATARKDNQVLQALAGLENLDRDVDDVLAKIRSAKVRAAWVSHPKRTDEERSNAARKETRMAVLSALAGLPGLDEDSCKKLASEANPKVSATLALNENVSNKWRLAAFGNWVDNLNTHSTKFGRGALFQAMKQIPGSPTSAAQRSSDPTVLVQALESEEMCLSTQEKAVSHIVAEFKPSLDRRLTATQVNMFHMLVRLAAIPFLSVDLTKQLHPLVADANQLISGVDSFQSRNVRSRIKHLEGLLSMLAIDQASMSKVVASKNPTFLNEVAQTVSSRSNQLAFLVACNVHATKKTVLWAAKRLSGAARRAVATRHTSRLDVVAGLLVSTRGSHTKTFVEQHPERDELLSHICGLVSPQHPASWLLEFDQLPTKALLELSPAMLANMCEKSTTVAESTRTLLNGFFVDDTRFELVVGLWDSWEGSTGSLLTSTNLLQEN